MARAAARARAGDGPDRGRTDGPLVPQPDLITSVHRLEEEEEDSSGGQQENTL
jgi:hypothetical protein